MSGLRDLRTCPRKFGQAVDPVPGVGVVVERMPRRLIAEAEVRAQIDDELITGQSARDGRGFAVGQGQEHDVSTGQGIWIGGHELAVGKCRQRGMDLPQAPAGLAPRCDHADLQLGVAQEQTQELAAGIAGSAGHRGGHGHAESIRIHA
jgi:hypothetical protein